MKTIQDSVYKDLTALNSCLHRLIEHFQKIIEESAHISLDLDCMPVDAPYTPFLKAERESLLEDYEGLIQQSMEYCSLCDNIKNQPGLESLPVEYIVLESMETVGKLNQTYEAFLSNLPEKHYAFLVSLCRIQHNATETKERLSYNSRLLSSYLELQKPSKEDAGRHIPLPEKPALVYDMLLKLPTHKALTTPQILDKLSREHGICISEDTFRKEYVPKLKEVGVEHKPKTGFWIPK